MIKPMAISSRGLSVLGVLFFFSFFFLIVLSFADDVSYDDDSPKSPGCDRAYKLVKVMNWVNGVEGETLGGITARFGAALPLEAEKGLRLPAIFSNPLNGCSSSSSKLSGSIAVSIRGDCTYTTKAEVAQLGGAEALLVINDKEGLAEMGCDKDSGSPNVSIPVVMIPKSAGEHLNKSMGGGQKVEIKLYAPNRPVVDFSVIFLWMMAVGTVICATLWSEFTAPEESDKHYNELSPKENASTAKDDSEQEFIDINAKSAVVFVLTASTFLVLLFFFMSSWFVWLLIILFCLGGVEGMHSCIVSLISRKCKNCVQKKVNLPLLGETSIVSLVVLCCCLAFAIFWIVNRRTSYSWIGQDILGICLMITVLQVARLPNIKVAAVLLCCAFVYDIFWVFLSPIIFHQSVMIAEENSNDILYRRSMVLALRHPRGLFLTYLGLYLMDGHGQPALLYLVPCTLGVCVILGLVRGEIKELWSFGAETSSSSGDAPGKLEAVNQ
ncbi:hypothetical protein GH714_009605 [Hevea brasiliensis]|uniref:PA domain-containing protein n=1 Tax=Hevea brasiliensis TaxID=3981 RepID=A0A6A6NCL9_HEVBR|nr:hypothetical protein GH714_009605 [Hevea brasiliensis]